MVVVCKAVDAHKVAHHEAFESPLLLEDASEELPVRGAGHSVDGVIGSHNREGPFVHSTLEGWEEVLAELPHAQLGRIAVVSALRNAVGHEMLECGDDSAVPSVVLGGGAANHSAGHFGGKADVFAEGFLDPGPAGFAGKVHYRAVAYPGPHGTEFFGDAAADFFLKGRIPAGRPAYSGGEDGGAYCHVPVRGLFRQQYRDAEAR